MKLIITHSIREKELDPYERKFSLETLQEAATKAIRGIGTTVKGSQNISGTILKKVSLTSPGGAGRALFLIIVHDKYAVLTMLRTKNDKKIGANMSIVNPKFKKILDENLDLIQKEITQGEYQEYWLNK